MKKIFAVLAAMAILASLSACGSATTAAPATGEPSDVTVKDVPVIGISQYGEHPSLDNCRDGFLQGLAEAGLVEGVDR